RTVVVDEEEGFIVAVVQMRNPDRTTEGATFLEKAVAVARLYGSGRRINNGVLVEVLVSVEGLIPYQEVKIAVIGVGAGDGIHGDDSARGAAILSRRIGSEHPELVDAIRRRQRGW